MLQPKRRDYAKTTHREIQKDRVQTDMRYPTTFNKTKYIKLIDLSDVPREPSEFRELIQDVLEVITTSKHPCHTTTEVYDDGGEIGLYEWNSLEDKNTYEAELEAYEAWRVSSGFYLEEIERHRKSIEQLEKKMAESQGTSP